MKVDIQYTLDPGREIIEQILRRRGIPMEWLKADESYYNDGRDMKNFNAGYNLLQKHLNNKIGILVDQDTDGFCSSAIIYQWLKEKYPNIQIEIIMPEGKVHGIMPDNIPDDIKLLIVPDASSSENDKHDILANRGIDILILDHHEFSKEESKNAIILNPHNPQCNYPNKNISGTGVVYKFIETIDKLENKDYYSKYIDLVAIATVADVMSLRDMENKAFVNIGLNNLKNKYFIAYLKADGRIKEKPVNPTLISFYVVPQINSLIRMGTAEDKIQLFKALVGEIQAEPVIAEIISIKGKQDRKKEPIVVRIVRDLQTSGRDNHNIIIAEAPKSTLKSMTGLIAGQLTSLYKKPVLLGQINENGEFVGSARSINDSSFANLKDICENSGLFNFQAG